MSSNEVRPSVRDVPDRKTVVRCKKSLLTLTKVDVEHCGLGALNNDQLAR